EALADGSDTHAGDGDDLAQHQFLLRASTMRSRLACQAGRKPDASPSANTRPTPAASAAVGKKNAGNSPCVGSPPRLMNVYDNARPSPPPISAMTSDSSSTLPRMRPSPKPSVFSTASSFVRSRMACAMVLPATSRMVNIAIATIHIMILPMSPICLAQSETNCFSVAVLVSDGELANIASIFAAICGAWSGLSIVKTYQL